MAKSYLLALALAIATSSPVAAEFFGAADKIIDGDSFWLCDQTICTKLRICGINTPERGEPGFTESRAALEAAVKGKALHCIKVGENTPCDKRSKPTVWDSTVVQCFAEGRDIAERLVEQGVACDCLRFSAGHYSRNGRGVACPIGIWAHKGCPATTLWWFVTLAAITVYLALAIGLTPALIAFGAFAT